MLSGRVLLRREQGTALRSSAGFPREGNGAGTDSCYETKKEKKSGCCVLMKTQHPLFAEMNRI